MAIRSDADIRFVQIAETDFDRISLSPVDYSFHNYPYQLLTKGSFHGTPWYKRAIAVAVAQRGCNARSVVITSYDDISSWVLLFQAILLRQKVIVSLDSTYADHRRVWYKEAVKRYFVSRCDGAFCYGTRSKEYLQMLGMPSSKIRVRCQAAPSDRIQAIRDNLPAIGWKAPAIHRRRYFLYVGRLSIEKGLVDLLEAYATIGDNSSTDLLIVGAGPMDDFLQLESRRLGIQDRVYFLGPKTLAQLVELYQQAYFLVLPSTSEPWGLVVNEAFVMRCPAIVASNCGCAPDLINHETGLVFQSGDASDLSKKLNAALALIDRRDFFGAAAAALIGQYTPLSAAIQMYEGISYVVGSDTESSE
jgi:glycosyltransferase involved in cell wall biosynthesis